MFRFPVEDDLVDGYKYSVGICTAALQDSSEEIPVFKSAGAIQVHKKTPTSTHAIGSFEQAEIMSGSKLLQEYSVLSEYFEIDTSPILSAVMHHLWNAE